MVAMGMMETAVDEIVDVVAVRNRLMPAAGSVDVAGLMALMAILRRTLVWVSRAHFNNVLVDFIPILTVQMSVMQIVDVVAVLNRDVTAAGAVVMRMLGMGEMMRSRHVKLSVEPPHWRSDRLPRLRLRQAPYRVLSPRFTGC